MNARIASAAEETHRVVFRGRRLDRINHNIGAEGFRIIFFQERFFTTSATVLKARSKSKS